MRSFGLFLCTFLLVGCSYQDERSAENREQSGREGSAETGSAEAGTIAQLNEACPENWCAGDYQYSFRTISCASGTCTLSFTAEHEGEQVEGAIRFDFDVPLLDEYGDLDVSYFERVTDELDVWERNR